MIDSVRAVILTVFLPGLGKLPARFCSSGRLQCLDSLFQRRVRHEQTPDLAFVRRCQSSNLVWQMRRFILLLQPPQRSNHLVPSGNLRTAGIRAEFTLTAEPHHDNRGKDTQHHLSDQAGHKISWPVPFFRFENGAIDDMADDPGEKNHEGIHDPWINASVTMSPLATWLTS